MAAAATKDQCIMCGKEKRSVICQGCQQLFCFDHLADHRQELSGQLDEIEMNRDIFRQTLIEQTNDLKNHSLMKQIDQWEEESMKKIQQTAKECRELLIQHTTEHIDRLEVSLSELTTKLREIRKENDFNEIDLNQFKQKLTQLAKELEKPPNVSIQQSSASLIQKISVAMSSEAGLSPSPAQTHGADVRPRCRWGSKCPDIGDHRHREKYFHPTPDQDKEDVRSDNNRRQYPCRYGTSCYDDSDHHRAKYSHTTSDDEDIQITDQRILCRYGRSCRSIGDASHRQKYSH